LVDEQAGSGLSQTAFCKRRKIALSTFAHWKRRLAAPGTAPGSGPRDGSDSPSSAWIDLGALPGSDAGWDIELDLGGGICLRLRRR
jgi:hypothetical protein